MPVSGVLGRINSQFRKPENQASSLSDVTAVVALPTMAAESSTPAKPTPPVSPTSRPSPPKRTTTPLTRPAATAQTPLPQAKNGLYLDALLSFCSNRSIELIPSDDWQTVEPKGPAHFVAAIRPRLQQLNSEVLSHLHERAIALAEQLAKNPQTPGIPLGGKELEEFLAPKNVTVDEWNEVLWLVDLVAYLGNSRGGFGFYRATSGRFNGTWIDVFDQCKQILNRLRENIPARKLVFQEITSLRESLASADAWMPNRDQAKQANETGDNAVTLAEKMRA